MATKKQIKIQKRQEFKNMVLRFLRDKEGPQRRDQILTDVCAQEKLCKDERNSMNQVIETMVERGTISLKFDADQRQCVEINDATQTITKVKPKKPRPRRGKAIRFQRERRRGPQLPSTSTSEAGTLPDFDLESGDESDED
ncbi:uncharacterized protein [Penaeus vannamei]|uniref:Uncharacterized protein n=1 Tax=Penaeus vannamei TaxID=6689 RepID=A0A3R7MSV0_PENVA|nr:uncharacterized protein LOC113815462 [Penaeus vannamei]XP_027223327.1 uncharacterized protein LOC113815462 [Penaeus vannamei]ROT68951.1 hypothetical protein C7M84_012880 [Penaeus vannamei]